MHTTTPKVENSDQVLSCQLKFVHGQMHVNCSCACNALAVHLSNLYDLRLSFLQEIIIAKGQLNIRSLWIDLIASISFLFSCQQTIFLTLQHVWPTTEVQWVEQLTNDPKFKGSNPDAIYIRSKRPKFKLNRSCTLYHAAIYVKNFFL